MAAVEDAAFTFGPRNAERGPSASLWLPWVLMLCEIGLLPLRREITTNGAEETEPAVARRRAARNVSIEVLGWGGFISRQ